MFLILKDALYVLTYIVNPIFLEERYDCIFTDTEK